MIYFLTYNRCDISNIGFNISYREDSSPTFREHVFIKDEFHHLNVSLVETFSVSDVMDCTFKCLSNPLCFSANLAAVRKADGKFWCELLSSDKYKNNTEYTESRNVHHFSLKVNYFSFHVMQCFSFSSSLFICLLCLTFHD